MRVEGTRFLPGCSAGLAEKTALVEVGITGELRLDGAAEARMRSGVLGLCPEEPLFGVTGSDWPQAFLVPDADADADADAVERDAVWRLGGWVVAVTVAIQQWARDPVFRGAVVAAGPGRLTLAVPWRRQRFFTEALELALRLVSQWMQPVQHGVSAPMRQWLGSDGPDSTALHLGDHFGVRWPSIKSGGLSPRTLRFVRAATARNMPFDVLPSYIQLGWGAKSERMDVTLTQHTGWIATVLAKNTAKANQMLAAEKLPVPRSVLVNTADEAEKAANAIGWPVVVRPLNLNPGLGAMPGITERDTLRRAFDAAVKRNRRGAIVEEHLEGRSYRLLVVRGRLLMTVRRDPGQVTGDGSHTITELVRIANADLRRGRDLKKITLNDEAGECMAAVGLSPDSVPLAGTTVALRRTPSVATGGTAADVSEIVHPENRQLAVRATRVVGLDIAGVDLITIDISRSWREVGGAVCAVNAQPAFDVLWVADPGRDLEGEVVDLLFAGRGARIPTVAVVGGDDAGAGAEALHRIWTEAGIVAGVCTRSVLRIGPRTVSRADLAGPNGVRMVLTDPAAAAAVFELPVDRLVRDGHPCDSYDVAAVLGGGGGAAVEVVRRARGAVVVDGDDPECVAVLGAAVAPRRIVVSASGPGAVVGRGSDAVFVDGRGLIVAVAGGVRTVLARWSGDRAVLFAAAVAWAQGVDAAVIAAAVER